MAKKQVCSIDGCGKKVVARGWCDPHYRRWRAHGNPEAGRTPQGKPMEFFQEVVLLYDGDDCLTWPYGGNGVGYGTISSGGKMRLVHRLACEVVHGPAPTSKHEAAHICGNGHKHCCNPRHLQWKTPVENAADRLVHGTQVRGERHGAHKLTEKDVLRIRSMAGTASYRKIGKMFGVSIGAVQGILSRKNWEWLE